MQNDKIKFKKGLKTVPFNINLYKQQTKTRVAGIIIRGSKILLMWRKKLGKEYYVFPGGHPEKKEKLKDALIREINEETTITIKIIKKIYTHIYTDGSKGIYYLCEYKRGVPKLGPSIEKARNRTGIDLYKPEWKNIKDLNKLLVYPMEIRDWLISDIKNGFKQTPRMETVNPNDLREKL